MWPILPKKCDCAETGTNTSETNVCNHCGPTTDNYVYTGEDLACIGIDNRDLLTTVFQKIDFFLCGGGLAQHIVNQFTDSTEFSDLVNDVLDCDIIINCGPVPTTTTTSSTSTTTSTSSTTTTTTTVLDCDLTGTAFQIY